MVVRSYARCKHPNEFVFRQLNNYPITCNYLIPCYTFWDELPLASHTGSSPVHHSPVASPHPALSLPSVVASSHLFPLTLLEPPSHFLFPHLIVVSSAPLYCIFSLLLSHLPSCNPYFSLYTPPCRSLLPQLSVAIPTLLKTPAPSPPNLAIPLPSPRPRPRVSNAFNKATIANQDLCLCFEKITGWRPLSLFLSPVSSHCIFFITG